MVNQKNFLEIFRLFETKTFKNKKAQFYLIAAIIIVGIIIILSGITNYIVTREKPAKFYDLSQEFKEEGTRVVDYGIYTVSDPRDTIELMENLSEQFAEYSEEKDMETELVFVFGNTTNLTTITYTYQDTGEVRLTIPGSSFGITGTPAKDKQVESRDPSGTFDNVNVTLLGQEYLFDLHEGENFFFVISKNVTETQEVYIASKE
jgi:hypothetical protein